MICPSCGGHGSKVLESRIADAGDAMRRRRECTECESRYTTYERVEQPTLWVLKSDGRQEPFACEKLLRGLEIACSKRDVPAAVLDDLVRQVEVELRGDRRAGGTKCVTSDDVGARALAGLVRIDEAAAIRFASVIQGAESLHGFRTVLEQMEAAVTGEERRCEGELGGGSSEATGAGARVSLAVV
jgi:transcriptional repressor NrdR